MKEFRFSIPGSRPPTIARRVRHSLDEGGRATAGRPKIRVLHLITRLDLGGAQLNTLYTVEHLDRSRYHVSLFAAEGGELAGRARGIKGAEVGFLPYLRHPVSPYRDIQAFYKLKELFQLKRPHIVHTHSSKAGILGRLAAAAAGVPVVVHTIHGWGMHRFQPFPVRMFYALLERLAAKRSDALVAVAAENVRFGLSLGIGKADDYTVIRSGIGRHEYLAHRQHNAGNLGFPGGTKLVGMVGPLKEQKAPLDFVRLAAMVKKQCPSAGFVLVGDGELRSKVEKLAAKLGLGVSFKVLGWRHDVPSILPALSVFVLTSRWEGLPRSLLQSLGAGVPAVATSVNGIPEVVKNGVNGYLYQPGDTNGMSRGVVKLLTAEKLRRRMGREARKAVTREFDIDVMVSRIDELYVRLLKEKGIR